MMIILNYLSCRHFAGLLSTYILFKFHFTPINNLPFLHNAHMHQTMVRSIYSFVDLCKYRIQIMVHGRLSSDSSGSIQRIVTQSTDYSLISICIYLTIFTQIYKLHGTYSILMYTTLVLTFDHFFILQIFVYRNHKNS